MSYTISRESTIENDVYVFFCSQIAATNAAMEQTIDVSNFDIFKYAQNHLFWIARRDGEPVGALLAQLYGSVFDPSSQILFQDSLFVKKSSGRAAFLLMKEFIDFGRANAKIIFTCRGKFTNVKARTLERLGFEKTEELFRLVVGDKSECRGIRS